MIINNIGGKMLNEVISNLESSIMKGDTYWENLDDHLEIAIKDIPTEPEAIGEVKNHLMTCCVHKEYML